VLTLRDKVLPSSMEAIKILCEQEQTMANMQAAQPQAPPPPPRDSLGDFQHTKPPTFPHAVDPMDAANWLKSVEKKLQVV
jgi:hypothetical protein